MQLDGNAELYRTVLPDAPKKKTRGKKNATELASTMKASATTTGHNVQKKSRPTTLTQVTPSPKLNQPNINVATPKIDTRQRDGFILDYLIQKAPAKVNLHVPETSPWGQRSPPKTSVRSSIRDVRTTNRQDQSVERVENRRASVEAQQRKKISGSSPSLYRTSSPTQFSNHIPSQRDDISTRGYQATPQCGMLTPANASDPFKNYPRKSLFSPPLTSNIWKQARQQQVRAQKHAFARERENPFSNYKHDPNDAESVLDALSQKTPPENFIIPPESLRNIETVHSTRSFSQGRREFSGRRNQQAWRTGRRPQRRFFSQPNVARDIPSQNLSSLHSVQGRASHQTPLPSAASCHSLDHAFSPTSPTNLYQGCRQHSEEDYLAMGLTDTVEDYQDGYNNAQYCPSYATVHGTMQSPYFARQLTPSYLEMGLHTASTPFNQSTENYQDCIQNSGEEQFAERSVGPSRQQFGFPASSTPFSQSTQYGQNHLENSGEANFAEGSVPPGSLRRILRASDEDMTQFASAFF